MGIALLLILAIGIALLVKAMFMVPAGVGILLRKQWGLILTLVLAALSALFYLGILTERSEIVDQTKHEDQKKVEVIRNTHESGGNFVQSAPQFIAAGQILYAILTFIILFKNRAEFSRPRADMKQTTASGNGTNQERAGAEAKPSRSVAVTAIGVITLLLGLVYAALGGWFLYSIKIVFSR